MGWPGGGATLGLGLLQQRLYGVLYPLNEALQQASQPAAAMPQQV